MSLFGQHDRRIFHNNPYLGFCLVLKFMDIRKCDTSKGRCMVSQFIDQFKVGLLHGFKNNEAHSFGYNMVERGITIKLGISI